MSGSRVLREKWHRYRDVHRAVVGVELHELGDQLDRSGALPVALLMLSLMAIRPGDPAAAQPE